MTARLKRLALVAVAAVAILAVLGLVSAVVQVTLTMIVLGAVVAWIDGGLEGLCVYYDALRAELAKLFARSP